MSPESQGYRLTIWLRGGDQFNGDWDQQTHILSHSLCHRAGTAEKFTCVLKQGLEENLKLCDTYYPGWQVGCILDNIGFQNTYIDAY